MLCWISQLGIPFIFPNREGWKPGLLPVARCISPQVPSPRFMHHLSVTTKGRSLLPPAGVNIYKPLARVRGEGNHGRGSDWLRSRDPARGRPSLAPVCLVGRVARPRCTAALPASNCHASDRASQRDPKETQRDKWPHGLGHVWCIHSPGSRVGDIQIAPRRWFGVREEPCCRRQLGACFVAA
jgi:hypothetical protein